MVIKKSRLKKSNYAVKMLGILFCFVFMLGIGVISSNSVSKADAPQQVRDSVVYVCEGAKINGNKQPLYSGSGFFVGAQGADPQYLVTNYHVVEDFIQLGSGAKKDYDIYIDGKYIATINKMYVWVYFDEDDFVEAYIETYSELADVAVMRLEKPTSKRKPLPIMEPTNDLVGNTVYAFGYPGLAENEQMDSVSSRGKDDMSITSGVVSRLATQSGSGVRQLQTDTNFLHGNSGGPLVTEDGVGVGITAWYVSNSEGEDVRYAVSMAEVLPLLNNNNIAYYSSVGGASADAGSGSAAEQSGVAASSSEGHGAIVIILIAVIVLLVVVICVVLVVSMKKKNDGGGQQITQINPSGYQNSGAPEPQSVNTPSGGAAGDVSPAPIVHTPIQNNQSVVSAPAFSVQGVAGIYNGQVFVPGLDGRITFGRKSTNVVSYEGKDNNISGSHCYLTVQDGALLLVDAGSKNGTYLENGTKLQSNMGYTVKQGDKFYLVNRNNMFVVL